MALPESNNQEQVSVAAQAFMQAGLQEALIQLLEETVLPHNFLRRNSSLSINRTLQNLLIITAIKVLFFPCLLRQLSESQHVEAPLKASSCVSDSPAERTLLLDATCLTALSRRCHAGKELMPLLAKACRNCEVQVQRAHPI